jgi:hypothetical protein
MTNNNAFLPGTGELGDDEMRISYHRQCANAAYAPPGGHRDQVELGKVLSRASPRNASRLPKGQKRSTHGSTRTRLTPSSCGGRCPTMR